MRKKSSVIVCRVVFSAITALLLIFIFGNSAVEGEDSGSLSMMVTMWLNSALEWMRIPIVLSHQFVRKLAHFTEYSLLGASMTAMMWSWISKPWCMRNVFVPLLCGGIAAGFDEWLQTFVPDRCGCVTDALLDFSGVLWAALAASALLLHSEKKAAGRETSQKDNQ